ncbi:hypothetical protein EV589_5746 [Mycobacterium sp. BK558]|nr:hypothetical protein EV589_5746 [Mycobacterium sp. BK558]
MAEAIAGASLTPSPTGITLAPLGFEFLHGVNFVLREQPGADIGDALVSRDCGGDPPVVAGEQFF